jgi:fructokinase
MPLNDRTELDVLIVGEALVDIIVTGSERVVVPGGSAANVALGLARRGVGVAFASYLAEDAFGSQIRGHLERAGVVFTDDAFRAPRTSTAIATVQAGGKVGYEFDVLWEHPALGGAVPGVLHLGSVPAFELDDELRGSLRSQRRVTFDPNIRPALLPAHDVARRTFDELVGLVNVLKLSDEDAAWLFPGEPLESVVDQLLAAGPQLVVATRGSAGLLLATPETRVEVSAPVVSVVDTIGAGDTVMTSLVADLVAGLLTLEPGDDLAAVGIRAAAAAAITVSREGADLPCTEDLAAV